MAEDFEKDAVAAAGDSQPAKDAAHASSASIAPNVKEDTTKEATSPGAPHHAVRADADAALELLNETGGLTQPLDPQRSARLLRKVDAHIMPLICIVYFLQYIDKGSVSYASVTGLLTSTGLKGDDFNWVASIFFFGQLTFEFPTIRLLQLFPLAKYVSVNVTLWGITLSCLAACTNYAGLLACRFFLGVLEAAIVPAWVLFTSQWYTKEEQAFRVGIWYVASEVFFPPWLLEPFGISANFDVQGLLFAVLRKCLVASSPMAWRSTLEATLMPS